MANFATLNELAIRLGRASSAELTAAQTAQGNLLLELASGLIREAAGKEFDWEPDPVPTILRAVCLDMCRRVMTNPAGVRSESETLGAHQHSVSYPDGTSDLYLTPREVTLVRVVSGSSGRATTIPGTTIDLLIELRDTGEIAAFPAQ
jgi:hypothetical protein